MSQPRVVITGIGIWSCLGTDCPTVTQALREGRSGIGIDPLRTEYGYQSSLTGLVERPKLKGVLDRRLRTGLAEEGEFAYMASREALSMAGIDEAMLDSREIGCIFGNDSSAKPVIEAANIMNDKHDSALLGSGFIFQSMNSTVTMNLSTIFRLRGINFTVSAACASGSHSIGLAYMLIRQGLQDLVLCGGAQEVNHYSMATFDALGAFSKRMDQPQRCRARWSHPQWWWCCLGGRELRKCRATWGKHPLRSRGLRIFWQRRWHFSALRRRFFRCYVASSHRC